MSQVLSRRPSAPDGIGIIGVTQRRAPRGLDRLRSPFTLARCVHYYCHPTSVSLGDLRGPGARDGAECHAGSLTELRTQLWQQIFMLQQSKTGVMALKHGVGLLRDQASCSGPGHVRQGISVHP